MAERAVGGASGARPPSQSPPCKLSADQGNADDPLQITHCDCHGVTLRAVGEIDLNGHRAWERALRQVAGQGEEIHLDLTELTFIDVRGVTLLVDIASQLNDGQRIVVYGAPPGLQRVMQVLWPDGAAAITIKGEQ
ncbi:STAS domain-containing protein [Glycomyces tarimensis]